VLLDALEVAQRSSSRGEMARARANGRIVAAGWSDQAGGNEFALARYMGS
jgi:hypothetical protein